MFTVVFALLSSLLTGVGAVLQQHEASGTKSKGLSPQLLWELVRKPIWVGATVMGIGSTLTSAVALAHGNLAVEEPLASVGVVFALPLASRWGKLSMGWVQWAGVAGVVGGIVLFLFGCNINPDGGAGRSSLLVWSVVLGGVLLLVAGLGVVGVRSKARLQALLWGLAGGLLYGVQDGLTHSVSKAFSHGFLHGVSRPLTWYLVTAGVLAVLFIQSAYKAAPLQESLPAATVTELVMGVALGAFVLGEPVSASPLHVVEEVGGILVMCVGVWVLSRCVAEAGEKKPRRARRKAGEKTGERTSKKAGKNTGKRSGRKS